MGLKIPGRKSLSNRSKSNRLQRMSPPNHRFGMSSGYRPIRRKPSKLLIFYDKYFLRRVLRDPPISPKIIENKDIAG